MTSAVVVFLDFDGVLHPDPCRRENLFCQLPVVEQVLLEYPKVELVISSSWRNFHPIQELRLHFSSEFQPRVVGVTPTIEQSQARWLPGHAPEYQRGWECTEWMAAMRPGGARWIAVDDCLHWFRPGCADLLVTDRTLGFVAEDATLLRHMLEERL